MTIRTDVDVDRHDLSDLRHGVVSAKVKLESSRGSLNVTSTSARTPPSLPFPSRGVFCSPSLSCEALMSRRLLGHERLGGLVSRARPLHPLSPRCVPPSSPLTRDNYRPAPLPKRVVGGRAINPVTPVGGPPGSQGPRAGPP